jgi:SAM-dependent methyltransferase
MELNRLSDKEVLEIGSGGGGHSALFMAHGARVTSVDITPERVMSTNLKMDLLRGNAPGSGLALCADAVVLPFAENAFDIAYSNGVLHHTANTDRTIEEVYRVVKPGGRAVIMLYARSSALYWTNLLIRGILNGEAFRLPESEWLGHITEGAPKYRREQNPITRVYNRRELLKLFSRFENVSLRKSSFDLSQLLMPRGGIVRERLLCALGHPPHEGGRIVYGSPYTPEIGWELALGHLIGFTWNVKAAKPVDTR